MGNSADANNGYSILVLERALMSDCLRLHLLLHSHFHAKNQSSQSISLELIERPIHHLLTVQIVDCVNSLVQNGFRCYETCSDLLPPSIMRTATGLDRNFGFGLCDSAPEGGFLVLGGYRRGTIVGGLSSGDYPQRKKLHNGRNHSFISGTVRVEQYRSGGWGAAASFSSR